MDKTIEEEITPGGSPGTNPENPPSSEAGLTDSGGGQPLPIKDNLLKCTLIKRTQQRQRCHSVGDKPKTSPAMPDMSEPSTSKGIDPAILTNRNGSNNEAKWEIQNKKRARVSPENANRKQAKLNSYWLKAPIPTSNRFEQLDQDESSPIDNNNNQERKEKIPKFPPIFVAGVSNIQPLTRLLEEIAFNKYEIKIPNDDQVKILPKSSEVYSTVVKELEIRNTEFHTYKPKQKRNFKVVLKNMHPSTDMDDLKDSINAHGQIVTNIWNVKQRGTKKPLPMFYVEIKPDSNNKQIYNIKQIYNFNAKLTSNPHTKNAKSLSALTAKDMVILEVFVIVSQDV
ncbi:nucleic-acid-binding protein from transposon x-element [Lasius niger]|uniref:Nucleic-acid-binding protein from transposon x-element n=1 Tax=Lasius niger TaxID=67767 RepID=A0A0J7K8H0_LASNI|nr:nucleic-acid-binding protein from transposon x-element [Lasius niger]